MKLGDVMKLSKGNIISIEDDKEYIIAGVQNYGAGILNKRKVKGIELNMKKYQLIKPNQLMWCKVDTKNGAFGITKLEHTNSLASTNMALAEIETSKCHPEFIEYLFRISFFHETITRASSGTTNRKYLTPTQLFENIEVPDFNKDEQIKWLIKVDKIINSGIPTELTHQLTLVKKLRQQLLQDAVQGKLVEQNATDEPAGELLKKIKAEKEKLNTEKKLKKEKELQPIKPEEIPFEIPENWVWCRLGEIILSAKDGPHFSPKYAESGIPFISTRNISTDGIDFTSAKYISEEYHKEISRKCKPEIGDLLYTKGGTTGIATVNTYDINFNVWVHVAVLRMSKTINSFYLKNCLNSPHCYKQSQELTRGISNQDLGLTRMVNISIPLPPFSEQNRIVRKLDELMQYCNELEASIKQSESQNSTLLQQVLREALRKEPVGVKKNRKS